MSFWNFVVNNSNAVIYTIMTAILLLSIAILVSLKYQAYILKDLPIISDETLKERVCYFGINSILEEKPIEQMFHKDTYKQLEKNANILDLDSPKLLRVAMKGELCHAIIEEPDKGLRVFDLKIQDMPELALGMGISTISEQMLRPEDME